MKVVIRIQIIISHRLTATTIGTVNRNWGDKRSKTSFKSAFCIQCQKSRPEMYHTVPRKICTDASNKIVHTRNQTLGEGGRVRETETETDRQTERQTETEAESEKETQRDRQRQRD